ncbi:MAG: non-homologous end-joining DNA ligase [Bradyrhizobiaceae bacterium]|nr:non-homologous end-joining DNA ligase [Bradyrhizobiaceae bacterium]
MKRRRAKSRRARARRGGAPKGRFTRLDKVFWPKEGFTKGDVIRYYDRATEYVLPYLRHRPMVLARHPNGIRGGGFFQKNVATLHLPPFVKTISIRAKSTGRNVQYVICDNKHTLLYLANLGCIEMHPWLARTANLRNPDFLALDLDPGGNPYSDVVAVARATRKVIEAAGGTCLVKTSGKTGIHVLVPLKSSYDFDEVREVAKLIGRLVHRRLPRLTTTKPNAGRRTLKVYLDYVRNSFGQTIVAPYSLRAFPGATVSTPLAWSELTQSLRPTRFTLRTVFRRLNKKGDVWEKAFRRKVSLRALARKLERMSEENKRPPARRSKARRR